MDESWLLPYSDLLTLLLALFIVLFAMSEVDTQKYKELAQVFKSEFSNGAGPLDESLVVTDDLEQDKKDESGNDRDSEETNKTKTKVEIEREQLKKLQQDIDNYIIENNLTDLIGTDLMSEGLLITVLTDVTFDTGSAEVNEKGRKIATDVSEFLDTNPPHHIVVSGFADDRPIHNEVYASNWELSAIRAVNFMKLILENENLDPARFSSKGYGEHHPIVPNTTEKNRAKNRRVEVLIQPNYRK